MTITQGVTIEAASGVTAFIHPPIGDAITINAGASDTVILRSLTLNGGASRGIVVGSAGILQIENCTITGFHDSAIAFDSGGALLLADSLISGNGMNAAVLLSPPGTAPASLTAERCRIQDNWAGIQFLIGTTGTIRDCVITGSHGSAITSANLGSALTATDVTLENCVISRNAFGFDVESGTVAVLELRDHQQYDRSLRDRRGAAPLARKQHVGRQRDPRRLHKHVFRSLMFDAFMVL